MRRPSAEGGRTIVYGARNFFCVVAHVIITHEAIIREFYSGLKGLSHKAELGAEQGRAKFLPSEPRSSPKRRCLRVMYELYELITSALRVISELNVGVSRVTQEWSKNSKSTLRVLYVLYECTASRKSVLPVTYEWYTSSTRTLLMHISQLGQMSFFSKARVLYVL